MSRLVAPRFKFNPYSPVALSGSLQTIHVCHANMAITRIRKALWAASWRWDGQVARCPNGNLMVYCPSCPEVGVNMEPGWEETPGNLRYVMSIALVMLRSFYFLHVAISIRAAELSMGT